jgi:hypothetical protein
MPFFKSTKNILITPWEDEVFDPNWMDSNKIVLPPTKEWDYSRELKIEDVEIWEVLYEAGGQTGVYASYVPYAEFYMVIVNYHIETFYGPKTQTRLQKYLKQVEIPFIANSVWVEPEKMYLY